MLAEAGGGATVLAGGQTLMPLLDLRMSQPFILVDINQIAALKGVSRVAGGTRIGPMTRQCEVLADEALGARSARAGAGDAPCRASSDAQSRHDRRLHRARRARGGNARHRRGAGREHRGALDARHAQRCRRRILSRPVSDGAGAG